MQCGVIFFGRIKFVNGELWLVLHRGKHDGRVDDVTAFGTPDGTLENGRPYATSHDAANNDEPRCLNVVL